MSAQGHINWDQFTTALQEESGLLCSTARTLIAYPDSTVAMQARIQDNSFWYQHRNNCIIEAVKSRCPDELFFDIGGGTGIVARGLEKAGIKTVLVEPGIDRATYARKNGLHHVICSTFANVHFKPASLPTIGLFDMIEHIENDRDFLQGIFSCLAKDGWVFITVPAYNWLWSAVDNYGGHFRRYTVKGLTNKLEKTGFKVDYATYIFTLLPLLGFLKKTLPALLGVKQNFTDDKAQKIVHQHQTNSLQKVLQPLWNYELTCIQKNKRLPAGNSCLVVAKKESA